MNRKQTDDIELLRIDAERYRWLRDEGCKTFPPFVRQWQMSSDECDAVIDNEMKKKGEKNGKK